MALYTPEFSILKSAQMIRLTGYEKQQVFVAEDWIRTGAIFFTIEVSVDLYTWQVKRRYSDFFKLHNDLSAAYDLSNINFPSKKSMYIQNEAFIKQRQNDLEVYLLTVVHKLGVVPKELADFLDFGNYEINAICDSLAQRLGSDAMERMVKSEEAISITPLELHAVCERLKLPAINATVVSSTPTTEGTPQNAKSSRPRLSADAVMATILEFLGAVKFLKIEGSDVPFGTSNIVPNRLAVDLSPFRSVRTLVVSNCDPNNFSGFASILDGLVHLHVHKSLTSMGAFLPRELAKRSNKSLQSIDFANNGITDIDESLQAFSNLVYLDLSFNQISSIEHLEHCTRLQHLNLSHNRIRSLEDFSRHVGNVKTFDISYNHLNSLDGLGKCGLEVFDASCNQLDSITTVKQLSRLPMIRSVCLVGNPICQIVDYRVKMLLLFGERSSEVVVDNQPSIQDELDRVAVLMALQQANLDITAGGARISTSPTTGTFLHHRCSNSNISHTPTPTPSRTDGLASLAVQNPTRSTSSCRSSESNYE